jgi:hypothetical protein
LGNWHLLACISSRFTWSGALSALTFRQNELYKRQLEAIDQLWTTTTELNKYRGMASLFRPLKWDAFIDAVKKDPKTKSLILAFCPDFDLKKVDTSAAYKARPYVSAMVWAYYSAIETVIMDALTRIHMLQHDLADKELINDKYVASMLKTALPEMSAHIDKYGINSYYGLLEKLDQKLLTAISDMLAGTQTDEEGVAQAARILDKAKAVKEQAKTTEELASENTELAKFEKQFEVKN